MILDEFYMLDGHPVLFNVKKIYCLRMRLIIIIGWSSGIKMLSSDRKEIMGADDINK